jgi:hypothetical protein
MRAIAHQSMDICISDLIVETGAIGIGKPLGQVDCAAYYWSP